MAVASLLRAAGIGHTGPGRAGRRRRSGASAAAAGRTAVEQLEGRTLFTALYWDPSGAATANGGSGTWNTTTAEWRSGSPTGTLVAWSNTANYDAVFPASAGTVTLGTAVTAKSVTFNATGYTVTGNTLTLGGTGSTGSVDVASSATATVSSAVAGTVGLTKVDSGTLVLTGANTYSGGTNASAGTVQFGNGGTAGTLPAGAVTDNATLALNYSAAATVANAIAGTGGVNDLGTGVVTLTAANTYSGPTTVAAGSVKLGTSLAAKNSTVAVNVNGGLTFATGITAFTVGGLTGPGNVALTNAGGAGVTLTVGSNGTAPAAYSGVLSGAGSVAVATGILTLSGSNTYTGGTTLASGQLNVNAASAVGTGTLTINGGAIDNTSTVGVTLANNPEVWAGDFTYYGSYSLGTGTGAITLTGNRTVGVSYKSLTVNGVISGATGGVPYSLTKTGYGSLVLNASNAFAGTLAAYNGGLQLGNAAAMQQGTVALVGAAPLQFAPYVGAFTVGSIYGSHALSLADTGGTAVTLTVANGSGNTLSGVVAGPGSLRLAAGTFTLSGANTYAGGTTVAGGTLTVADTSGSGTGTGAVAVQSGGSLSGTGTASGAVSVAGGGTLSPGGTSVGTLTTGALTLASGSTLAAALNGNAAGTGYDQVSVSGSASVGGATLSLVGTRTGHDGTQLSVVHTTGGVTGTFAGLAQGASTAAVNGVTYAASYSGGAGGTDFVLTANPATTTTTLAASPASANAGQPVTLTVTVASAATGTPTGTVTFYDGAAAIGSGTVAAGGTATLTTTSLAAGTHSVTATYGGDPTFAGSASPPVTVTVGGGVVATGGAYANVGTEYDLALSHPAQANTTWTWTVDWGDPAAAGYPDKISSGADLSMMNHAYLQAGTYTVQATATATTSAGSTYTAASPITVTVVPAPVVQPQTAPTPGFQVNGGAAQRSTVGSITVTFSEPVSVSDDAFTFTQTAATDGLTPGVVATGYSVSPANALTSAVTLTFPNGALANGTYTLSVDPAKVKDAHGQHMEHPQQFKFARLFGDFNGTGTVGPAETATFNAAMGTSYGQAGYLAAADANADGTVNGADAVAFGADLGVGEHPNATLNPATAATAGKPVTLAVNAAAYGNDGDRLTYQWFVADANGTEVALPGSYGAGVPLASGVAPVSPQGSVVTTVPQLTFVPAAGSGTLTAHVVVTDTDLGLATTTGNQSFAVAANADANYLTPTFGPNGLASLSYDGTLFAGQGGDPNAAPQLTYLQSFFQGSGSASGGGLTREGSSYTYDDNTVPNLASSVTYSTPVPNELDATVTYRNNTSTPIASVNLTLAYQMYLNANTTNVTNSNRGPSYEVAQFTDATTHLPEDVVFGIEEQVPGSYIGYYGSGNNAVSSLFTTGNRPADDAQEVFPAPTPIQPGQTATYHVFIRVAAAGAGDGVARDVAQAYSTQAFTQQQGSGPAALVPGNEPELNWTDRRPIGESYPGTNANLYNQLNAPGFGPALVQWAGTAIGNALQVGAQGVNNWDLDVFTSDHTAAYVPYVGDPTQIDTLAPQLDTPVSDPGGTGPAHTYFDPAHANSAIDEYFAMFRKAGLRTGVTIREQQYSQYANQGGGGYTAYELDVTNEADDLISKVQYANARWGCTLFYIDSDPAGPTPLNKTAQYVSQVLAAVHAAEPNVLLIPEATTTAAASYAARYQELQYPGGPDQVPAYVLDANPAAFAVIRADHPDANSLRASDVPAAAVGVAAGNAFFYHDDGLDAPATYANQAAAAVAFNDGTSAASHGDNDQYVLRLDAAGQNALVVRNGLIVYSVPTSYTSTLAFAFYGANDNLTVDFSYGNPVPAGGVSFNGNGTGALTVLGQSGSHSIAVAAGTVTVDGQAVAYANAAKLYVDPRSGNDALSVAANASVTLPAQPVGSGIFVRQFSSMNVASGAVVAVATPTNHGDRVLVRVPGSAFSDAGTLDLGGNDLDVVGGSLAAVAALAAAGETGALTWTGTGIASSAAATNPAHVTALGVVQNTQTGAPLFSNASAASLFDGTAPAASDVLVKYTYYGDANLDGQVDNADAALLSNGYNNALTGWYNGDFNYDGTVDGNDYSLSDNGHNLQGSRL